MIIEPNKVSALVGKALLYYDKADEAKRGLNHKKCYEHCNKALNYIAIVSYMISNEEEPATDKIAIEWVDELPTPNGLYQMLIDATNEISEHHFPLLDFVMSYPKSVRNISLIYDAIVELFTNIEKNDDEKLFSELLVHWKKRL
ncbi:MAG: hypothetical protein FK734_14245 [Asgard group archaeon]|nr:hypothetical protein [Asgard group archaeon]